ncbi:hypothetical protein PsorP6_009878 [Peronosclerospora sorghi]|uniref:Uncharacterized protein n=1 Tax=Peronosclerospora sorghi TaxID=230839 RepID=A0ACC0VYC5_9STRA|nr:hypothetical protein PsorP6_009878 [Peronosclerospora sorghi]
MLVVFSDSCDPVVTALQSSSTEQNAPRTLQKLHSKASRLTQHEAKQTSARQLVYQQISGTDTCTYVFSSFAAANHDAANGLPICMGRLLKHAILVLIGYWENEGEKCEGYVQLNETEDAITVMKTLDSLK